MAKNLAKIVFLVGFSATACGDLSAENVLALQSLQTYMADATPEQWLHESELIAARGQVAWCSEKIQFFGGKAAQTALDICSELWNAFADASERKPYLIGRAHP